MNTLYDLVARVLDARDGYNDPASLRRGLRAAIWGADQVTQRHAWTDYHTESTHLLNAPVNATASIDATGKLTINAGTLPAWMEEASVKIENRLHLVAHRNSDTEATLENYAGPALTNQTATIVHDRLIIRDDVRQIYAVRDQRNDIELIFVSAPCFHTHQVRHNGVPSEPMVVTSLRRQQHVRRTELCFSPPPARDTVMRVAYYRVARKATVLHDCGALSIANATPSVATITKPIRIDNPFDLVLVLSGNATKPDAAIGFSVADANPPVAELSVDSLLTPTTLKLSDDYQEVAGRGAILTQRLDLPPHAGEAAAMYAEAKFLQIGNGSHGDFWQTVQIADAEMRLAMEQEAVLARHASHGPRVAVYTRPETVVGVNP